MEVEISLLAGVRMGFMNSCALSSDVKILFLLERVSYTIKTAATNATLGQTKPSSATWSFPITPITPTITFGAGYGKLIGFEAGTYPTDTSVDSQLVGTKSPQISVVNSVIMTCNLVSNPDVSVPHNALYSFPVSASYGNQIQMAPFPSFVKVQNNTYTTVDIALYSQDIKKLDLFDTSGLIMLVIEDIDPKF
jgi:hypothetical protein